MPKRSRSGVSSSSGKRRKTSAGKPKKKKRPKSKTSRRTTKGVSKAVKSFVAKAVDARVPDTKLVMHCGPVTIPRQWNGTGVGGRFNYPIPANTHFFLHEPWSRLDGTPGMGIPTQIGLRHLENVTNIGDLTIGQLVGSNCRVKSMYIKGRYYINQANLHNGNITDLYIRTLCLEDKAKTYEELKAQADTPLYVDTKTTDYNPAAGINYKINRDSSGYATEEWEDRELSGYQYPNELKLCRSNCSMYSMGLPINGESFKVLGKVVRHARQANYKPIVLAAEDIAQAPNGSWAGYTTHQLTGWRTSADEEPVSPDEIVAASGVQAVCPQGGSWEIPFKMNIKAPKYLRWDNVHKRLLHSQVVSGPDTSGPQNFTPFLLTHLFSPNPALTVKNTGTSSSYLDKLVSMEYRIYVTLDVEPKI